MSEKTENVTIPKVLYDQLMYDTDWLSCLESAGVDNWEGIDYAQDLWREGGYAEKHDDE